jgi:ElaB/YqjD/DUF883 family membrane-anchored ribosome-binding protein
MDFEKGNIEMGHGSPHLAEQTHRILDETKKLGNQIYDEGRHKVEELQDEIRKNSDMLIEKVQEKPVQFLLIAAGIGFILSRLLHK